MDVRDINVRPLRKMDEKQVKAMFASSLDNLRDSIFKRLLYRKRTLFIFFGQMGCLYYSGVLSGIAVLSNVMVCILWALIGTLGLYYYEALSYVDNFGVKKDFDVDRSCFKYYSQDGRAFFVALSNKDVVGMVAMDANSDPGSCRLSQLSVLPAYKSQGIDKKLVLSLEKVARQYGYRKIVLETTVLHQTDLELHASLGYTKSKASYEQSLLTAEFELASFEKLLE